MFKIASISKYCIPAALAFLSACVTTPESNVTGVHGAFFNSYSDYHTGKNEAFERDLKNAIPNPDDTTLVIFMHGTTGSGIHTACDPVGNAPDFIREISYDIPGAVGYYHCTNLLGGKSGDPLPRQRAVKRAHEMSALLDRFHAYGISPERIFISGNSGGAAAALFTARFYADKFNGFIASAPGYGYSYLTGNAMNPWLVRLYAAWKDKLSEMSSVNGMVLAYANDKYSPPKKIEFLKDIPGVRFLEIDNPVCDGYNPHSYFFTSCFTRDKKSDVVQFIKGSLANAGVVLPVETAASKLPGFANKTVCSFAVSTASGTPRWETRKSLLPYVEEAKLRNLRPEDCVEDTDAKIGIVASKLSGFTNKTVCSFAVITAIGKPRWETRKRLLPYVEEAIHRGLSPEDCPIRVESLIVKISDTNIETELSAKSDRVVCTFAVNYKYGWITQGPYTAYAKEAQRRGFSVENCRKLSS